MNVTMPLFATNGDTSIDYLTDYWHEANRRWFRKKMKPVPIVAAWGLGKRTLGTYGLNARAHRWEIQIHQDLLFRLDDPRRYLNATNVVLHEMIHQYLQQHIDWRGLGHGPEFTEWCNRIASDLGQPRVYQRKPPGKTVPLARYWPHYIPPAKTAVAA